MPRDCPECGNPLPPKATQCAGCGYSASGKTGGVVDHNRMRCEWMSAGERCRYAGSISPATLGSGPWYCREHFGCPDMTEGAAIVKRSVAAVSSGASYSGEAIRDASRRAFVASRQPPALERQPGDD